MKYNKPAYETRFMELEDKALMCGLSKTYFNIEAVRNPLLFSLWLKLGNGNVAAGYNNFNLESIYLVSRLTDVYYYLKETPGRKVLELFDESYTNQVYKNMLSFRSSINKLMFGSGYRYNAYHKYFYMKTVIDKFSKELKEIDEKYRKNDI
jgi:hypothetical protein